MGLIGDAIHIVIHDWCIWRLSSLYIVIDYAMDNEIPIYIASSQLIGSCKRAKSVVLEYMAYVPSTVSLYLVTIIVYWKISLTNW